LEEGVLTGSGERDEQAREADPRHYWNRKPPADPYYETS
jgi:hypothetical protein